MDQKRKHLHDTDVKCSLPRMFTNVVMTCSVLRGFCHFLHKECEGTFGFAHGVGLPFGGFCTQTNETTPCEKVKEILGRAAREETSAHVQSISTEVDAIWKRADRAQDLVRIIFAKKDTTLRTFAVLTVLDDGEKALKTVTRFSVARTHAAQRIGDAKNPGLQACSAGEGRRCTMRRESELACAMNVQRPRHQVTVSTRVPKAEQSCVSNATFQCDSHVYSFADTERVQCGTQSRQLGV